MIVQGSFSAYRVGVNATLNLSGNSRLGRFIAETAGTLTLTIGGVVMLNAIPVAIGQHVELPISIPTTGANVISLGGGASGCVLAA